MVSWVGKKILVADDSTTMRMFIMFHLLKILPVVQILEAVDGLDALEILKKRDVDMVLTDMNMPGLDGAGLIATIRAELKKDLPIIIITTKGREDDRERGLAAGADGYITKPLDVVEFRKTLMKYLGGPRYRPGEALSDR